MDLRNKIVKQWIKFLDEDTKRLSGFFKSTTSRSSAIFIFLMFTHGEPELRDVQKKLLLRVFIAIEIWKALWHTLAAASALGLVSRRSCCTSSVDLG